MLQSRTYKSWKSLKRGHTWPRFAAFWNATKLHSAEGWAMFFGLKTIRCWWWPLAAALASVCLARLQSGQGCEFLRMLVLWVWVTHGYKFAILQQSLWLFLNGSTPIFGGFPKQEVQLTSTNPSLQQLQKSTKLGKSEPWKCSLDGWGRDRLCKETLFFFKEGMGNKT